VHFDVKFAFSQFISNRLLPTYLRRVTPINRYSQVPYHYNRLQNWPAVRRTKNDKAISLACGVCKTQRTMG